MKKFLALALAIVMMMAISIPALAEQIDIGNDFDKSLPYEQGNIDVLVRLDTDGDGTPDIDDEYPNDEDQIYVALSWENIEFVYNNANESWEDLDNFISVSNQSGIAVTAAFSYTDNLDNEADYDVDFTVREVPVEDPETSETYMSPRIYKAEFDADNNIATLERGLEDTSYADIAVNLAEGAAVPEEDSKVAVGYITVAIAAVSTTPEVYQINYTESEFESLETISVPVGQPVEINITEDDANNVLGIMSVSSTNENFQRIDYSNTVIFNAAGEYEVDFTFDNMSRPTVTFVAE